jgi:hydroxypyruvate isomerase
MYDRYLGTEELMPDAHAVSAKSYDFDDEGNETSIDYKRMMEIVKRSGYQGYVGIEYEGNRLGEDDGIIATKKLLEKFI